MSLNRATLIGRLGQDPKISQSQSGNKFATFSLATSETWKDKQTGEKKEQTDWHNIIVSSPVLTEFAEKYLRKGMQVFVEGRIRTRKYTGSDNIDRYVTEIVLVATIQRCRFSKRRKVVATLRLSRQTNRLRQNLVMIFHFRFGV